MEYFGGVRRGPRNIRLNFCDRDPDPQYYITLHSWALANTGKAGGTFLSTRQKCYTVYRNKVPYKHAVKVHETVWLYTWKLSYGSVLRTRTSNSGWKVTLRGEDAVPLRENCLQSPTVTMITGAVPSPRLGGHTHSVTEWRRAARYLRWLSGGEGNNLDCEKLYLENAPKTS